MSVDAVVVGSGASGAWMARTLAEGGARVLLLEAGPLFPGDHRVDRTSHLSRHQPVQSRSSAYEPANSHLFVDDLAHPYETADDTPFDWFRGRQVGGRLLLWAGVCPRMTDRQLSGEGTGRRWPIRLTDLAPHYQRVEQFMRVTATSPTRAEARLAAAVSARWPGRRVLPAPTATTAAGSILAAALRTGRVQLRPEALVSHLEMAPGESRARAVVFVDTATGTTHRQEAAVIALCASTVETVRILLNTRTGGSPDGLGNEHDQLGRHLLTMWRARRSPASRSAARPARARPNGTASCRCA